MLTSLLSLLYKFHSSLTSQCDPQNRFRHTFQDRYFEFSRVDALALERLTSNPYVMSVHGFCGVSVVTERGTDSVGHVADHLSSRKKVDLARKVAKSIAAVHEIDGKGGPATLVHNDLTVDNVFWGRNGPLLNDFNIAVLMMKDEKTGESCPFPGHYPNPQVSLLHGLIRSERMHPLTCSCLIACTPVEIARRASGPHWQLDRTAH